MMWLAIANYQQKKDHKTQYTTVNYKEAQYKGTTANTIEEEETTATNKEDCNKEEEENIDKIEEKEKQQ